MLLSVFDLDIEFDGKITATYARRQRYWVDGGFIAPLINTMRTPKVLALFGEPNFSKFLEPVCPTARLRLQANVLEQTSSKIVLGHRFSVMYL